MVALLVAFGFVAVALGIVALCGGGGKSA